METQTIPRDNEATPFVLRTEKKRKCRCEPVRLLPDLTAFLSLLAPAHLNDLAQQCGISRNGKGKDPAQQAQAIAHVLESSPGKTVRLRNRPKRRSARARSPYAFEKDTQYLLGQFGSSIWDVSIKRFGEQSRRELSLRTNLPFQLEIDFGLHCLLQNRFFGVRLIVAEDVVIPEGVTVVTDLQSIHFEGRLTMHRNARFYGMHHCGLELETDRLSGINVGAPGAPQMSEWPLISTSVRPLGDQVFNYEQVNPDYDNLWRIINGTVRVNGEAGEAGANADPSMVAGAKGADGDCDWWGLGGHTDPQDGESHAGRQGQPGARGEDGEDGHSAATLKVLVNTAYEGHVRFEARGGNGGRGGRGGTGQHLVSGTGGDVSRWCASVTQPGQGGAVGRGGDAGQGGAGGNGGNGGTIRLTFPSLPDERLYRACVRKGEGGRGGHSGNAGSAHRGQPGRWLDLFTNEPDTPEVPDNYYPDPVRGAVPDPAPDGHEGWNGSIYVNGELKVATNQNNSPGNFRYPVGDITAGGGNSCWD